MNNAYGQLYVDTGASAQALTATPAKLTGFAAAGNPGADAMADCTHSGAIEYKCFTPRSSK